MSLRGDNRGQSNVIGAILIFAIVISVVGANQTVLVPQNNKEIEFNHYQSLQSEMSETRSDMVLAAGTNRPQSATINLGEQYPVRALALNPAPVSGSLQTGAAGPITTTGPLNLPNTCGWSGAPETKTITYTPNYNYLSSANPIKIDNGVAYQDTSGDPVFESKQVLVRGDDLTFIPLKGDLDTQTSASTTVDFIPSETGPASRTANNEFEIEFPSELSASVWKNELLDGESRVNDVEERSGGRVAIILKAGDYDIKCTTIGINQAPDVTPASSSSQTNPGSNTFNPVGTGEVELESASIGSNTQDIDVELDNNRANDVDIIETRVIAYTSSSQGQSQGNPFNPPEIAEIGGSNLVIGGMEKDLASPITIKNTQPETVTYKFYQDPDGDGDPDSNGDGNPDNPYDTKRGDWMIVSVTFETQGSNPTTFEETYIIAPS